MKEISIIDKFNRKYNLLTILGPTASGKTAFAAYVAHKINAEIISADSRQVYRGMDLGTGKDIEDYVVEDEKIPYHLIDIVDAGEKYNLFRYQKDFFTVYADIKLRNKIPLLCGGSGLYIDAIVSNYDLLEVPPDKDLRARLAEKSLEELAEMLRKLKKLHNVTEIDTKKRAIRAIEIEIYRKNHFTENNSYTKIKSLNIGIRFDREMQKRRITERLKVRLEKGMIDEVKMLLDRGVAADVLIYYGLEYKYITLYLLGKISYDEMFEKLNIAIHQFSKRQMTWFRRMERKGVKIYWFDAFMDFDERFDKIIDLM
jgi:tRNA dimethylallyltransferase